MESLLDYLVNNCERGLIGWFLSAYFLGGYAEDGRGMNGLSKAVLAAAKSWGVGIPVSFHFIQFVVSSLPVNVFVFLIVGTSV